MNRSVTKATHWVRIYSSGPIEIARQTCRQFCLREGLCVTVDPTLFVYTGGEEAGFVIGLINYPRFPKSKKDISAQAKRLALKLLRVMHQHSILIMNPTSTEWVTKRKDRK